MSSSQQPHSQPIQQPYVKRTMLVDEKPPFLMVNHPASCVYGQKQRLPAAACAS